MWIEKKDEEQDQSQTNTQNPSVGAGAGAAPVQVQGSSTAATGNASSVNPTPNAPGQKFGTIQDYFKANKNQGEKLGEQFISNLDTTKQKSQQQIGEAAEGVKRQIANNTIGYNQNLVSQAASDPTKITSNEDDYNKFMQQWNAAYKGPELFEQTPEYDTAAKAAQEAKNKSEEAKTTGGRQQLLQDEFKVYGAGNKGLDEALLQQSSQFGNVGEKAKELGTIQDYLTSKSQEVGTEAQKAKATTEATKAQTQGAFANKLSDVQADLNNRVAAKKAEAEKIADKYKTDLAAAEKPGGNVTELINDLRLGGASPQELAKIQDYFQGLKFYGTNTNLDSFLSANPNVDVTPANVATPEDYAKAKAYQQLTGVDYSGVLNPADAEKAGQPEFIRRSNSSLEELQKLADAQMKNFGSVDAGLLRDIEIASNPAANQGTEANAQFKPVQNPFDVGGLTSYLQNQVQPKDKDLLANNLTNNIASILNISPKAAEAKGGLSNITKSPDAALKVSTALIQAAERTGNIKSLQKYYDEAKKDWDQKKKWYATSGGGAAFNPNDPKLAGEKAFINSLGAALGQPKV